MRLPEEEGEQEGYTLYMMLRRGKRGMDEGGGKRGAIYAPLSSDLGDGCGT